MPSLSTSKSAPAAAKARRLPDFLGLGGMRCGSTTLWNMLKAQPDIFLPEQKELHYFDNKDGLRDQGLSAYADYFRGARPEQKCGEITPEYLSYAPCLPQIHSLLPGARLVVVLRDPVQRAWSHYTRTINWGGDTWPFFKGLRHETQRIASGTVRDNVAWSYLERGRYVEHLRRWELAYGREALLVLLMEDLSREPAQTMRRIRRHIGLSPDPPTPALQIANDKSNEQGPFPRNLWLNRKLILARNVARQKHTLAHRAARRVLAKGFALNARSDKPQPTPEAVAFLKEYYKPWDTELEQWLGRKLPWRI